MPKKHELLLTFFYSGKVKKAPGTVGSFFSALLWIALTYILQSNNATLLIINICWLAFLAIIFVYGSLAIPIYTKKMKQIDHPSIVLDETLGQVIALQIPFCFIASDYFQHINLVVVHFILSFAFFRFFDITKPSLIGYFDRHLKNGYGVMLDDFVAGIFGGICTTTIVCFLS